MEATLKQLVLENNNLKQQLKECRKVTGAARARVSSQGRVCLCCPHLRLTNIVSGKYI